MNIQELTKAKQQLCWLSYSSWTARPCFLAGDPCILEEEEELDLDLAILNLTIYLLSINKKRLALRTRQCLIPLVSSPVLISNIDIYEGMPSNRTCMAMPSIFLTTSGLLRNLAYLNTW
jgi:hypothetical protein